MNRIVATKTARLAQECHDKFSLSDDVKNAISKTNREEFVPAGFRHNAYKLDALPLSSAQWISSPLTVAKMTHYLEPKGADRVLEVGCGSGYQAAVLSHLFRGVFTIERIERSMIEAKSRFRQLNINNIHTRTDDGQNGWIQYAPYDRILISAGAKNVPTYLYTQLKNNGIIVCPVRGPIVQIKRNGLRLEKKEFPGFIFVPLIED